MENKPIDSWMPDKGADTSFTPPSNATVSDGYDLYYLNVVVKICFNNSNVNLFSIIHPLAVYSVPVLIFVNYTNPNIIYLFMQNGPAKSFPFIFTAIHYPESFISLNM